MKLSEYIKVLQEFAKNNPDNEVVMTQWGYYADGGFADLYDKPEIMTHDDTQLIVLGNSHQSF